MQGGGLDIRKAANNDVGGELSAERRRRPSCGQHVHGTGRHHQLLADSDPPVRSRAPSHHPSRLDQPGTSLIVALFILHVQLPVTDYSLSALYPVRRVAR